MLMRWHNLRPAHLSSRALSYLEAALRFLTEKIVHVDAIIVQQGSLNHRIRLGCVSPERSLASAGRNIHNIHNPLKSDFQMLTTVSLYGPASTEISVIVSSQTDMTGSSPILLFFRGLTILATCTDKVLPFLLFRSGRNSCY